MEELRTHRTDASVDDFIAGIADDARREDCLVLLELMGRASFGVELERRRIRHLQLQVRKRTGE